ncbi:inositol monophosphatase family protein [Amycolatopsis sp. CA-128772]|uniref:inositol monophosphatase family protein n=1 Tax=Amycolatopsis sp. CA-128772 TaxID=2073159 RepID=UPI001304F1BA|nr:inositol monophosphatase family protein [Amycolatopsis sp. CA-128772]
MGVPVRFGAVAAVVAEVARQEVLSRFRRLRAADVWEKAAGDFVTAADVAAERRLAEELCGMVAGSVFVGEEGVAADRGQLELLRGERPVWIADPLDGTANFVRGNERFCVMVALALSGSVLGAWLCAPALGLSAMARAGAGAVAGGRTLRVPGGDRVPRRVVVTDPAYRTAEDDAAVARLAGAGLSLVPCSGVGVVYLELALGRRDAAVFGWTNVWDHAAGVLLHQETGGYAATADGPGFPAAVDRRPPLVLARTAATAAWLRRIAAG